MERFVAAVRRAIRRIFPHLSMSLGQVREVIARSWKRRLERERARTKAPGIAEGETARLVTNAVRQAGALFREKLRKRAKKTANGREAEGSICPS